MLYRLLRPLLFRLPPETAHRVALTLLDAARPLLRAPRGAPRQVMGLEFANPIGVAAGLDKNADHVDALGALGFGFIEVGTVTPRPQTGNPPPRLFRLEPAGALINRLGFNNKGVDYLVARLQQIRYRGVIGVNIGKNRDTPAERAVDDYLFCLRRVYRYAGYVTVNVSSPNTPGLRALQHGDELDALLAALKAAQRELAERYGRYVPLALKIAPDLDRAQIVELGATLRRHRIDAAVATNTTLSRSGVEQLPGQQQNGGLSGAPLFDASTAVLKTLRDATGGELPLIGVGGVDSALRARQKMAAGASLVQLYTGLIYRGPALVRRAIRSGS